jgi:amino acid adenylation domain-containing protein
LRQQDLQKAEAFWRPRLCGFTEPTPIIGGSSLFAAQSEQETSDQQEIRLSPTLMEALRALTREHHLTLNTLAQGCWALILSRYSGESDVVFGSTVSGRPPELAGAETMIGLFINTLPVRVGLRDESVLTWLERLQAEQAEISQYVYTPLAQLQRWSDLPPGVPLFETLIVFENYPIDASLEQMSASLEITSTRNVERTNYALTLVVVPGEELTIKLLYNNRRFSHSTITRMLSHLENTLQAVAADLKQDLSRLRLISETEAHAALVEWNDTETEFPVGVCFHQLVENRVLRAADSLAVSCEGGERLTYAELNQRANQLAHYLRRFAVAPEVRVGICVGRSAEMVIARLAVLKAGGAYISLDPEHPQARLAVMLEDAEARVLVTEERFADRLAHCADVVICVDKDREIILQESENNLDVPMNVANLAYVYFTSGSTGKPKGVEIEHSGLVNLVTWHNSAYRVVAADRKSQISGLAFDASVWELWPYLVAGASVHIPTEETRASWPKLLNWMVAEAITICFLPTPLAEAVIADEWPGGIVLRAVLTGGDKLHRWPQNRLPFAFVNKYGPTEVSAVTTWAPMHPTTPRGQSPPIGRPIANTETFVLGRNLQPVPIGVPGELYIGGIGLARGYVNQPDTTAEKFIPHPFSNEPGRRLYKSGDLVCYQPDGNLEFLGRHDSQVKIRGYRIELSEIENSLVEHADINEAVILGSEDQSGGKHLVAYFVPAQGVTPEIDELRKFLKERLPAYMVPARFVSLNSLPINRNGKVDRRALLSLKQGTIGSTDTYVAPQNLTQEALADIWTQVLGIQRVGIHDNFFELGGDSISSIRIIARAGQKGIDLSPNDLFLYPTISQLARESPLALNASAAAAVEATKQFQPATTIGAPPKSQRLTLTEFPNVDLSQAELDKLLAKLRTDDKD